MSDLHFFPFAAMGSPCEIRFYCSSKAQAIKVAKQVKAEVYRIEAKYSRYRDDSITSQINNSAGSGQLLSTDEETATLLNYANVAHKQSEGMFDITSGILRNVWDFKVEKLPTKKQIDLLLPLIGWEKVQWENHQVCLPLKGMELDFGGYVKEYCADAAVKLLIDLDINYGLVDLGGDIAVVGPQFDGSPWLIGVRDPKTPHKTMAMIGISQGGLASSGDYEHFIEVGGERYCHILNPFTGWPVPSLASVSVLAERCLIAGTVTTIAMLKGQQSGSGWLETIGLPFLLLDRHGDLKGTIAYS